jgi:hypothetical protein
VCESKYLRAKVLVDFVDGTKTLDSRCDCLKDRGGGVSWLSGHLRMAIVGRHFSWMDASLLVLS